MLRWIWNRLKPKHRDACLADGCHELGVLQVKATCVCGCIPRFDPDDWWCATHGAQVVNILHRTGKDVAVRGRHGTAKIMERHDA